MKRERKYRKIVSVVCDQIERDPRASKFRDTLNEQYDVFTLSVNRQKRSYDGHNKLVKISIKNNTLQLLIYWFCILSFIKKEKPDLILSHNYYTAFPCWIASKWHHIPLAYDAYEFYVPEKGKSFSLRNWFFFLIEKFVVKRADYVFAANSERARLMKNAFKLQTRPIAILNIPSYKDYFKKKGNLDVKNDKIIIVYEGFVTFTRYVNLLIDALGLLPNNFELVIIGDGPDVGKMKKQIEKKTYKDRIDYRGRIDSRQIIPAVSECTVGFVGYPFSNLNNKYCSPNKIYEYPVAGIPFVSSRQTSIWGVTNPYHICAFYDAEKDGADGIKDAILEVVSHYRAYTEGIEKFNQDNNWDVESRKILEALA